MKAVIFDLFGTLVPNLPPARWQAMTRGVAKALGVDPDTFYHHWAATYADRMTGVTKRIEDQMRAVVDLIGKPHDEAALKAAAELKLSFITEALTPREEAVEVLTGLQASFKLGMATDCSWETPDIVAKGPLGAFFPVIASSAHVGARKPDPRMYAHVLDGLGVQGADCLYVGDGNSNELVGARGQGMRTAWIDNGDQQYWKVDFKPEADHTITSLREVPGLLQ